MYLLKLVRNLLCHYLFMGEKFPDDDLIEVETCGAVQLIVQLY